MLVMSGLREAYNGLKSTILTRKTPTTFSKLHGLLSDHDYMVRKSTPEVSPVQAFTATTTSRNITTLPVSLTSSPDQLQALQQLLSQLGVQLQPTNNQSAQAF